MNRKFLNEIWNKRLDMAALPEVYQTILPLLATAYCSPAEKFPLLILTLAASYMHKPVVVATDTWKESVLLYSLVAAPAGSNKVELGRAMMKSTGRIWAEKILFPFSPSN